jgi:hypothetical protein
MRTKKTNTPQRLRHYIERMRDKYVVVDSKEIKFEECATREEAEKLCNLRNGIRLSTEPPSLERLAKERAVTPDDIDTYNEVFRQINMGGDDDVWFTPGGDIGYSSAGWTETVTDIAPPPTERQQKLIDDYKKWLPRMLAAWADMVAGQCGYGAKRRAWDSFTVGLLMATEPEPSFRFPSQDIVEFHWRLWPTNYYAGSHNRETAELLALHYLSGDPAHAKAKYFEVSERQFYLKLDAAHRWLARKWVG